MTIKAIDEIEFTLDSLDLLREHGYADEISYKQFAHAWETVKALAVVGEAYLAEEAKLDSGQVNAGEMVFNMTHNRIVQAAMRTLRAKP